MDRMRACGVCDVGSIPTGGTNRVKQANCFACGRFVNRSLFFQQKKQRGGVAKIFCDGRKLFVTRKLVRPTEGLRCDMLKLLKEPREKHRLELSTDETTYCSP